MEMRLNRAVDVFERSFERWKTHLQHLKTCLIFVRVRWVEVH